MPARRVREHPSGGAVRQVRDLARYEGPLLLDTHIWLWHLTGDAERLSPALVRALDRAGAMAQLYVSDISCWEVAVKAVKGKLTLAVDVERWLARAERAPGIRFVPVDRATLVASTVLPGPMHGDPADRMLVATARLRGMPLVTADAEIVAYARATGGTPVVEVGEAARG